MPDAIDPSTSSGPSSSPGTTPPPPPAQAPAPPAVSTPAPAPVPAPGPKAPPDPQTPLGVTFGKAINVPNNFLGAGIRGKGWTITGEQVVNGQRVVTLGRRVEQTGAFETQNIDAATYQRAKEYKDEQGGMTKSKKGPVLGEHELGRAIDPQGDLIPEFFDAATHSYRLRLPGGRTPVWVDDSLILNLKEGKSDALAKLRRQTKLDEDSADSSASPTATQLAQGAVASAILGKSLATRLGLRAEKQETSPDRPSTDTTPASQKTKDEAKDRAAKEEAERQKRLEGKDEAKEEEEEGDEEEARGAAYRTNTYTATNKPGESAQVRSDTPGAESTLRVATNRTAPSAVRFGTPLPLSVAASPAAEATDSPSSDAPAQTAEAINEPQRVLRSQAPKSRDRKKRGEEAKRAALEGKVAKPPEKVDVVQATLDRAAARKAKKTAQEVEQRFRSLSQNPEFKKLLFVDIDKTPAPARAQIMQEAVAQWDERQHAKKVEHIEKSYDALEVNPEFKQLAYQIGLEHLQNDPDDYFRKRIQGRTIALDRNGWVLDMQTGENLGHVLSTDLKKTGGLSTGHQIKQKALQAWHIKQAQAGGSSKTLRVPRAVTASQAIRKNAPKSRAERPISLESLGNITKTPKEHQDIRSMRAFLSAQQKTRSSNAGLSVGSSATPSSGSPRQRSSMTPLGAMAGLLGAYAGLTAAATAATSVPQDPSGENIPPLAIALQGLIREQALAQVQQAQAIQSAQVESMRTRMSTSSRASAGGDEVTESEESTSEELTPQESTSREATSNAAPAETPTNASPALKQPLPALNALPQEAGEGPDAEKMALAAELLAAEQKLAQLQAVEAALQALPDGSTVPNTFAPTLPIPETPSPLAAPEEGQTLAPPEPPLVLNNTDASRDTDASTTTSAAAAPPAPAKRTRVGVPSTNRLSPPSRGPTSAWSRIKNRAVLPLAFASMANLGSAQAMDRASGDDPRAAVMNSDTSVPSESTGSMPQASSAMTQTPSADTEEGPDVQRSTQEEARDVREAGQQAQANQEQFSGKQPAPPEGETGQPSADGNQAPQEGPSSPNQQMSASAQMNAAQQQDKQTQKNQEAQALQAKPATTTTATPTPSSPRARATVIKLGWDLIEGTMDLLGFGEFLVEANLALANDFSIRTPAGPSLRVPGTSERTQRYIVYSVLLLDGLIALLLLLGIALIVVSIVMVICGTSIACILIAAAT